MDGAMPSDIEYPDALWIGTKKAYANGYPCPYVFANGMYVCASQTTENGQTGEIMAIIPDLWAIWFVAVEGRMIHDQFVPRQACFRTQEHFWETGWHNWETNQKVCKDDRVPDPEWDSEWWLRCDTKHLL